MKVSIRAILGITAGLIVVLLVTGRFALYLLDASSPTPATSPSAGQHSSPPVSPPVSQTTTPSSLRSNSQLERLFSELQELALRLHPLSVSQRCQSNNGIVRLPNETSYGCAQGFSDMSPQFSTSAMPDKSSDEICASGGVLFVPRITSSSLNAVAAARDRIVGERPQFVVAEASAGVIRSAVAAAKHSPLHYNMVDLQSGAWFTSNNQKQQHDDGSSALFGANRCEIGILFLPGQDIQMELVRLARRVGSESSSSRGVDNATRESSPLLEALSSFRPPGLHGVDRLSTHDQQQYGLAWAHYAMHRWFSRYPRDVSLFVAVPGLEPVDVAGDVPRQGSTHYWTQTGPLFPALKHAMRGVSRLTLFLLDYGDFDYRARVGEEHVLAALDDVPMLFVPHWNFYVDANGELPSNRFFFIPDPHYPINASDNDEIFGTSTSNITWPSDKTEHRQQQLCADGIFNRSDLRDPSLRGCSVADVEQYGKQQLGRKRRAVFWRGDNYPVNALLDGTVCDHVGHSRYVTVLTLNRMHIDRIGNSLVDVGFAPCRNCIKWPCKPYVFGGGINETINIDVDGYASSWAGLRRKMMSWAAVIKIVSDQNFVQWYYPMLQDGVHLHLSEPTNVVDAARYIDSNPEYQLQLAVNAVRFAAEHLRPSAVRAYLFDAVSRAHENAEAVGRKSWLIRPRQKPASGGVNVQQMPWPKRLMATRNIVDGTVNMQPGTLHCGDGLWEWQPQQRKQQQDQADEECSYTVRLSLNRTHIDPQNSWRNGIVVATLTSLPLHHFDLDVINNDHHDGEESYNNSNVVVIFEYKLPCRLRNWACPILRSVNHPWVLKVRVEF